LLFLSYLSVSSARNVSPVNKDSMDSAKRSEVCYDDLGCIVTDFSWFDLTHRPVNLMPLARHIINTTFTLHTRELKPEGVTISANDTSSFKPGSSTKIIAHGFLSDGNEQWLKTITTTLLKHGDYNVIVVHWPGGSGLPYTRATANTRLVGLEIAHLVNTLVARHGLRAANVHLIGHSLGAHIAGYAGEKIAQLGRITGLDPAGPYFEKMPTFVRLDPTDAHFVDAIHTDGSTLGLGLMQPVGHLDFYPNGGGNQPGCGVSNNIFDAVKDTRDVVSGLEDVVACSHMRAIHLFTDSIFTVCQPVAYECKSHDAFTKGHCVSCGENNTKCSRFGLEASMYPTRSRTNVKLYMETGKKAPFCRYHYAVELRLANPVEADKYVSGQLDFTLKGMKGLINNASLTRSISAFYHGNTKRFLHVDDTYVKEISNVKLQWRYISDPVQLWTFCLNGSCNKKLYVKGTQVSLLNNYPEKKRIDNTYNGCSAGRSMCIILPQDNCNLTFRPECAMHGKIMT